MNVRHEPVNASQLQIRIPQIPTSSSCLDAAIMYADAGIYVLPVEYGQKNPGSVVGRNWPEQSSRDLEQIFTWFVDAPHGIALHLGRSGLLAIDVDYPETLSSDMSSLLASSDCPYQSTRTNEPDRGHYLFRLPPGVDGSSSPGNLGKGWGDVRGGNAVIIAAPSHHGLPDGRYRWIRTGEVPTLPKWLQEQLRFGTKRGVDPLEDTEVLQHIEAWGVEGWFGDLLPLRLGEVLWRAGSRHDTCQKLILACLQDARVGAYPATVAIRAIYGAFVAAKPQEAHESAIEFRGMVRWAVAAVASKTRTECADHRDRLETELWLRSERGQDVVRVMMTGGNR